LRNPTLAQAGTIPCQCVLAWVWWPLRQGSCPHWLAARGLIRRCRSSPGDWQGDEWLPWFYQHSPRCQPSHYCMSTDSGCVSHSRQLERGRGYREWTKQKLSREQVSIVTPFPLTHGLHGGSLCKGTVQLGAGHQLCLGEKLPALKTEAGAYA